MKKKTKRCATCNTEYTDDQTIPFYQRYTPLVIVSECETHGLFFVAPQTADLNLIEDANSKRSRIGFDKKDFTIDFGPKSRDLISRGINNYLDLFSSKQIIYLNAVREGLGGFDHDVRLKFSMLVSTSIDFNSMLCGYKGSQKNRPGAIRHTFAHHAYSFPYTSLENNPLHNSKSSGTLLNLFHSRVIRGAKWAKKPVERKVTAGKTTKVFIEGEVDSGTECYDINSLKSGHNNFLLLNGSSTSMNIPDDFVDYIVTDPPYFDSVQYSDLSHFFRVWLKQFLPIEVNWDVALDDAAVDQHKNGDGQYRRLLTGIFSECNRVLKPDGGRLIFTFHHWNPKGWSALTRALASAGFQLIDYYVIHAENQSSVHIVNQKALIHDVILVLGKKGGPISNHKWELPVSINKNDSYEFCLGCGNLIGHLLQNNFSEGTINDTWKEYLA